MKKHLLRNAICLTNDECITTVEKMQYVNIIYLIFYSSRWVLPKINYTILNTIP